MALVARAGGAVSYLTVHGHLLIGDGKQRERQVMDHRSIACGVGELSICRIHPPLDLRPQAAARQASYIRARVRAWTCRRGGHRRTGGGGGSELLIEVAARDLLFLATAAGAAGRPAGFAQLGCKLK